MIRTSSIDRRIENFINHGEEWGTDDVASNQLDQFIVNQSLRIKESFELYKENKKYYGDFLSSLRNYLLTNNTSLFLESLDQEHFSEFGLYSNPETKKVSASYSFPKYLHNDFTINSFLNNYVVTEDKDMESNLCTDPFILQLTGFDTFRSESQKIAVYGALKTPAGYTTMISIPTGGGKSLVTQTIAYQGEGLTIVIVPTVSLSIDQERVTKKSLKRAEINNEVFSYSSGVDSRPIIKAIKAKTAKLLFISPEALLLNSGFRDAINEANKSKYLKNIVIDEAHIVADWGALFRVDYQCLESWRDDLMVSNPSIRTILLSATFERRCTNILKDLFAAEGKWIEVRCDELRKEPRYVFTRAEDIPDKKRKLLQMVRLLPHPMIVYVASPSDADELKDMLAKEGFNNIKTYTGKTNNTKRKTLIDDWVANKYEVMIATSAFGVGVNKSDVRTIVHAYVPQNANTYYQELGRAGRDKLPCLSVMCVQPKIDGDSAFQKISKRVMTTEKICKRWIDMYNNPNSIRKDDHTTIDTSIKPQYRKHSSDDEEMDTYYSSGDTDMNWNVYVLLFLRRSNLLDIEGVRVDKGVYYFQISKINPILFTNDPNNENLIKVIEEYRSDEYNYYVQGLRELRDAIKNNRRVCWSEMFYNVYEYVNEYCAGCGNHSSIIDYTKNKYTLKKAVNSPISKPSSEMMSRLPNKETIVIFPNKSEAVKRLLALGINIIVSEKSINDYISPSDKGTVSVMTVNRKDLLQLADKQNEYFLSGTMVVDYPDDGLEMEYIKTITSFKRKSDMHIVHLMSHNIYVESAQKYYSDIIDAPIISNLNALE